MTLVDLEKKKEESASIPRILHFTWKTNKLEELPELFRLVSPCPPSLHLHTFSFLRHPTWPDSMTPPSLSLSAPLCLS